MKLLLSIAGLAMLLCSCRTVTPIDPNTGKQSTRMLPDTYAGQSSGSGANHSGK